MEEQFITLNEYQTSIKDLNLDTLPKEIVEQFWEFFYGVPYIQNLVSVNRLRAKDLQKDKDGKIVVDITRPHILEDMDYFRPSAIHFQKTGKFTDLRPNPNPNSEYGLWIREEVRRCHEGFVRPSDGEWITGDYYFFLNYFPIALAKKVSKSSKESRRVIDFPLVWDGHYLAFHYYDQARKAGKHCLELSRRSSGKSFRSASRLAKRFVLGENQEVNKKVTCYAAASDKTFLVAGDQLLDKFQFAIDFVADNTEFPRKRLINTIQNMQWIMGYLDLDSGTRKGTLNSVIGVSAKDNESKLRGTRGVLYILEECGSFPRLLELWQNLLPSVEEGENVFGQLVGIGTAGDSQSDFYAMAEMMYHPDGYHVYGVNNVYDILGKGAKTFTYFFPGYINRANCYDENGNSDVTKALLEILKDRHQLKYNSTDINAVAKRTAEHPIVPQEAIMKTTNNIFPITELNERIAMLENDETLLNSVYVGQLKMKDNGKVVFESTTDTPIRFFPHKDNKIEGALEIFEMPVIDSDTNRPYTNRYIASHDPVDQDTSDTVSLSSTFVLDLITDQIVAEYTGRKKFAEDNYEIVRLLCMFYNCQCLYENNLKGLYGYFQKMNCLYLLKETPEYLRDKDLIKAVGMGNMSKGVRTTVPIIQHGEILIRDWLLSPVTINKQTENGEELVTISNLFRIKNLALLKELVMYNKLGNFDRVMSLIMLMIHREDKKIVFHDDFSNISSRKNSRIVNDDFFKQYDRRY